MLHRLNSAFVLGYHGCDKAVAEKILSGEQPRPSRNDYDWLGHGVYFWEANPLRGLEFARELKKLKRPPDIETPAVIGAVIDLGYCLDLTTSIGIQQVRDAHKDLKHISDKAGRPLPTNSKDLLRRHLDCAVIDYLHEIRKKKNDVPIDTIRGVFTEGNEIYPDSGFLQKTHIQICVCRPDNIKGMFRVERRFLT